MAKKNFIAGAIEKPGQLHRDVLERHESGKVGERVRLALIGEWIALHLQRYERANGEATVYRLQDE